MNDLVLCGLISWQSVGNLLRWGHLFQSYERHKYFGLHFLFINSRDRKVLNLLECYVTHLRFSSMCEV